MIAFREMVVEAAKQANIKVPENLYEYNPEEFPHWHVYCNAQVGYRIPRWGCHWDNAFVVAEIPDDQIMKVTIPDLLERGFEA